MYIGTSLVPPPSPPNNSSIGEQAARGYASEESTHILLVGNSSKANKLQVKYIMWNRV